jgi:hypothetical protein
MLTIEEAEAMLDEIAEELPVEFYKGLNGGILLLPETKWHPENRKKDLYIMGEYSRSFAMGRYISIYYGSFQKVHGHLSKENFREELKKTLIHEFTHHMESLAGDKSLEIKDAQEMEDYRRRFET